ncbi:unnamed protein product [Echinostoma caproni]|uniref:Caveolin n=1 Tax=Echinostoma caproni TaxID=27848 RepID=A0A183B3P1_9TREM|nr:unnamed protein product [Echinostoma caproni]
MNGDHKTRKRRSEANGVNFAFEKDFETESRGVKETQWYSGMDEAENDFPYTFDDTENLQSPTADADRLSCWKQCAHGVRCKFTNCIYLFNAFIFIIISLPHHISRMGAIQV